MIYPEADKLEAWGNKYALVTLAAKRAKQLKGGAAPLIETSSRNPLTIALEEIALGKITTEVAENDIIISTSVEPEIAQLLAIPGEAGEATDEDIDNEAILTTDDELEEAFVDEEDEEEEEEVPLIPWNDEEEEVEEEEQPLEVDLETEDAASLGVDDTDTSDVIEADAPARKGRKKSEPDIDVDLDIDIDAIGGDEDLEEKEEDWEE